jgi:hypothetical protein
LCGLAWNLFTVDNLATVQNDDLFYWNMFRIRLDFTEHLNDVHALNDLSKHNMLSIQVRNCFQGKKDL